MVETQLLRQIKVPTPVNNNRVPSPVHNRVPFHRKTPSYHNSSNNNKDRLLLLIQEAKGNLLAGVLVNGAIKRLNSSLPPKYLNWRNHHFDREAAKTSGCSICVKLAMFYHFLSTCYKHKACPRRKTAMYEGLILFNIIVASCNIAIIVLDSFLWQIKSSLCIWPLCLLFWSYIIIKAHNRILIIKTFTFRCNP